MFSNQLLKLQLFLQRWCFPVAHPLFFLLVLNVVVFVSAEGQHFACLSQCLQSGYPILECVVCFRLKTLWMSSMTEQHVLCLAARALDLKNHKNDRDDTTGPRRELRIRTYSNKICELRELAKHTQSREEY